MLPQTQDANRAKAQQAAQIELQRDVEKPERALVAYLQAMIGGRMDAKYPMRSAMNTVSIEWIGGPTPFRASISRGSQQGEVSVGTSLATLVDRINDKYFVGDDARKISFQGAALDVEKARLALAPATELLR